MGVIEVKKQKCEVCGREFIPKVKNQRFCSRECRTIYFNLSVNSKNIIREVVGHHTIDFSRLVSKYGIKAVRAVLSVLKKSDERELEVVFRWDRG